MDYFLIYFNIGFIYTLTSRRFKEYRKQKETFINALRNGCLLGIFMLSFPIFVFLDVVLYLKSKKD